MSKNLSTLITVSVFICCSGLGTGLPTTRAIAVERESVEQSVAKSSSIEVTFEGLMILHRQPSGHYEVGILIPERAHKHTFRIEKDGKEIENLSHYLSLGKSWILEVTRPSGGRSGTGMSLRNRGQRGRLRDSRTGQFDFSWAVDLESPEFHGRQLTLTPGYLKPIIQLPDGELYTKYKSPMVQRKKGPSGEFSDFGFVAETTALTLNLQQGEELVFRVEKAGTEGVIFRSSYGSSHEVAIHNRPDPPDPTDKPNVESHFTLYYGLFSDVRTEEKYDFRVRKPRKHPFNEYPLAEIRPLSEKMWVDSLPCGLGLLGKRSAPLE